MRTTSMLSPSRPASIPPAPLAAPPPAAARRGPGEHLCLPGRMEEHRRRAAARGPAPGRGPGALCPGAVYGGGTVVRSGYAHHPPGRQCRAGQPVLRTRARRRRRDRPAGDAGLDRPGGRRVRFRLLERALSQEAARGAAFGRGHVQHGRGRGLALLRAADRLPRDPDRDRRLRRRRLSTTTTCSSCPADSTARCSARTGARRCCNGSAAAVA